MPALVPSDDDFLEVGLFGEPGARLPSKSTQRIDDEFGARLKPKLDAVENVRFDLTVENIEVPGVVAIGNQSAAKSSVLEAISGINFPRGENTCTRRPCMLRMESDPKLAKEYAQVSNDASLKGAAQIELHEIGGEIERLTREQAGPGTTIISEPLHVKVYKKSGPTLTLIDLPGITHVHETQTDIHEVIVAMIKKYIKNEQTVILAVVPAVDDFANCEALKLAREVDPHGVRTLGVVTKPDTIQQDSDLVLKLRAERGSDIALNLGWISVRCRTPTEVKEKLSGAELAVREKTFFEMHPLLSELEQRYWGLPTLIGRIVDVQEEAVDRWLPQVKLQIQEAIFEKQSKLIQVPALCDDDSAKRVLYNRLVGEVREVLDRSVNGSYTYHAEKELHIPPRLAEFFAQFKTDVEEKTPDFLSSEYTAVVEEQDSENRGCSLPNFLSDPVFRLLFLREFEAAVPPAVWALVARIREYISKVVCKFVADVMADFPRLVSGSQGEVRQLIRAQHDGARAHLGFVLDSQKSIGTLDEVGYTKLLDEMNKVTQNFVDGHADATSVGRWTEYLLSFGIQSDKFAPLTQLRKDKPRIFNMQISLAAYTQLIQRQLLDHVTKLCYLFFVEQLRCALADTLYAKDTEFIRSVLQQDPKTVYLRKSLELSIERLTRSLETLDLV